MTLARPITCTPRLLLVTTLIVVAPVAAIGHLLVAWAPAKVRLMNVQDQLAADARALENSQASLADVARRTSAIQTISARRNAAAAPWLPRRMRDDVFDRIAAALRDPRISVEHLTVDEPALFAAASRSNLLACERVQLECYGPYAALTSSLDRLLATDLPLRVARLNWSASGARMQLTLSLEVPFVPDAELGARLADAGQLKKDVDPNEP